MFIFMNKKPKNGPHNAFLKNPAAYNISTAYRQT